MKYIETERYIIEKKGGKLIGREKKHTVLKNDRIVLIQKLGKGEKLYESISSAFDKIQAESEIKKGDHVAIKINLGGGIHGILPTYSDPVICEAIIKKVKELGGKPFVCEADMRAHIMHDKLLKIRGYYDMLKRNNTKFVNLSKYETVDINAFGLDIPLKLPLILLKPDIKIISFAPPKHHWECGITCSQKNMYGAIAEQRKSIYHRKYERIDRAVAAAARLMVPHINILATYKLGAGMGPHFCFPIDFDRIMISKDMIRCDYAMSEILGYPYELVKYAMINAQGGDYSYDLHPDSDWPDENTLREIKENSINYESVNFWKPALWLQYYVPHIFQIKVYPPLEFIFTAFNYIFYKNKKVLAKLSTR
ncbi:MAG: DUF362 domain-containing protein [Promethearchaeota archaeon]